MFRRQRRRRAPHRPAGGAAPRQGTGLQICEHCQADYVHPVEWRESGDEHWWMLLRCGACRADREVVVANAVAERFGRELDAVEDELERTVRELDCERMAREAETFAQALERDLIDANDFGRRIGR
jgi:hypothetical protein